MQGGRGKGIPSEGHCMGKGVVVGRAGGVLRPGNRTDVTALEESAGESRAESQRLLRPAGSTTATGIDSAYHTQAAGHSALFVCDDLEACAHPHFSFLFLLTFIY